MAYRSILSVAMALVFSAATSGCTKHGDRLGDAASVKQPPCGKFSSNAEGPLQMGEQFQYKSLRITPLRIEHGDGSGEGKMVMTFRIRNMSEDQTYNVSPSPTAIDDLDRELEVVARCPEVPPQTTVSMKVSIESRLPDCNCYRLTIPANLQGAASSKNPGRTIEFKVTDIR